MSVQIAAVLLAAGASTRMGRPKQLLPLGSRPVISHCISALNAGGISQIIAVVGQDSDALTQLLGKQPVMTVMNRVPGSDMAESLKTALPMVSPEATGVLVFPADHPLVTADTVRRMREIHMQYPERIIIPAYQKRRGHPTLFPRTLIEEIFMADTLRDIIAKSRDRIILMDVTDEGVVLDLDTEEDYEWMQEVAKERGLGSL